MILIDGVLGEGGGQILRTSLGLSLYTGQPFRITNIRAGRRKPGLLRQHLTAVKAARDISGARVEGAELKSQHLEFIPGTIKPGKYRFAVGTAGSATLVFQTILPAILTGATLDGEMNIHFEGGTHNIMAPPFDFLQRAFLGVLTKMGADITAELNTHGFYPAGGGSFHVKAVPVSRLLPVELLERGSILRQGALCLGSQIPQRVMRQEAEIIARRMQWPIESCIHATVKSPGPGNVVMIDIQGEAVTEVFTAFGEKGTALRSVVDHVVNQVRKYLAYQLVIGEYLADQLLVPMAIAGKGSFITGKPTLHTETNIAIIKRFLDIKIDVNQIAEHRYQVEIA